MDTDSETEKSDGTDCADMGSTKLNTAITQATLLIELDNSGSIPQGMISKLKKSDKTKTSDATINEPKIGD